MNMDNHFSGILPPQNILVAVSDKHTFLHEWRGRFSQDCLAVILPETTQQVSECVQYACDHNICIVPQSGNTGLVGGQMPCGSETQVILSTKKMNKILDISSPDFGITAQAGVPLAVIQRAAEDHECLFPLSLASEGSATIGGLISTNAGGTHVLKYGNMRDLVFGLEVVLANGKIISDTHYLRKHNTNFDLKHLFIGAEGFHGIVTAASLKLFPRPRSEITALIAVASPESAILVLEKLKKATGDSICEFELMPKLGLEFVFKHSDHQNPLSHLYPWYCLITANSGFEQEVLQHHFIQELEKIYTQKLVLDCIIAESLTQSHKLRQLRMLMSECQKPEGASIKHDVSVPVRSIPALISEGIMIAQQLVPDIRPCPFGHAGDGNIHFNFSQPVTMNPAKFMEYETDLNNAIFEIVQKLGGCFSAEHGIGSLRISQMHQYRQQTEIELRQNIKSTLDKYGVFNPNKIL